MISKNLPLMLNVLTEQKDPSEIQSSGQVLEGITSGKAKCLMGPDADVKNPDFLKKVQEAGLEAGKVRRYYLRISKPADYFANGKHENVKLLFTLFGEQGRELTEEEMEDVSFEGTDFWATGRIEEELLPTDGTANAW